jgi:hypothetical protein
VRKSLDKSRKMRSTIKRITFADTRDLMGKLLWHLGLLCQLLWHIIALAAIADHHYMTAPHPSLPASVSALLSTLSEASSLLPPGSVLGRWGLICSVASLWWNPKFKHWNRGFSSHIKGFGDWYKHQFILFVVRGLFYFIMRDSDFAGTSMYFSEQPFSYSALIRKLYSRSLRVESVSEPRDS